MIQFPCQVDVVFPASPLFLWWDYRSIQLLLKPILEYAINNTDQYGLEVPYDLPWAPHHLGHWPGKDYLVFRGEIFSIPVAKHNDNFLSVCNLHPEDQEQMPVEESGNMVGACMPRLSLGFCIIGKVCGV